MDPTILVVIVPVFGTPIVVGLAWWVWFRTGRTASPTWRRVAWFIGLLAASANATMYYAWLTYKIIHGWTPRVSRVDDLLGDRAAEYLAIVALAGAMVGKGAGRLLLLFLAIIGFLLWIKIGIL